MTESPEPASPPLPKECTCGMDGGELLPCPFCGGAAMLTGLGYDGPADCYDVYVQCSICDSEGQSRIVDKSAGWDEADSVSEAIAAWNRRTPTHRTAGETTVAISREDADIIRRMMEEFFHRKELSPEETTALMNLCNAGDFGRPVPKTIYDR